jgi:hypothetical protein
MPRKHLDVTSEDNFVKRVYLLKAEMDSALLAPDLFKQKMEASHLTSVKPPKFQIKVSGPVVPVLEEVRQIKLKYPRSLIRIMKMARDRKVRNENFVCDNIRVYVTVR